MGKLTTRSVDALKEPGRYSDGEGTGFHLRIDPKGRKYYVLRVNTNGRRRDINIGSVKRMTLAAAREKARRTREELEAGVEPSGAAPTFARAAELAHQARTVGYRNKKHVDQWLTTLETYANPIIGEKPVDRVTRGDVVAVLTPIWMEKPETARRVLQRIDRVMRWAVGNDYRHDRIDMTLVRDALPRQPRQRSTVRRMPSLPWQEAPAFWTALHFSHSAPEVRLGLGLLMLTAVRPGNVPLAKRRQFDLENCTWTIPAEEMKAGDAHRVPLSPAAIDIVKAAMVMHSHELLFTVSGAPMSGDTLRMMMRRMGRSETPHGFRSTFKEWARAHGWADELSEAALAHIDPNAVRAAYARADLLDQRRPMMEAWAEYLTGTGRSDADPQPE